MVAYAITYNLKHRDAKMPACGRRFLPWNPRIKTIDEIGNGRIWDSKWLGKFN
jgi:hypothetical protein